MYCYDYRYANSRMNYITMYTLTLTLTRIPTRLLESPPRHRCWSPPHPLRQPAPPFVRAGVAGLALGRALTIVVKQDGSLWSTGRNHNGQLGDGSTTNKHSFVKVTAIATTAAATTSTTATTASTNTTTTSFLTAKGTSTTTTTSADGGPKAHPALLVAPIAAFGVVVIGLVICFIVRTIPKRKEVKVVIGRGPDIDLYQSNDDE